MNKNALVKSCALFILSSEFMLGSAVQAWQPLGDGLDGAVKAIALDNNGNLYAGGSFLNAGSSTANYIAKWNGSTWSAVGTGTEFDFDINALAINGTDLYVGGSFSQGGGSPANYIARWDGSAWSALAGFYGGVGTDDAVNTLVVKNSKLYVGGAFTFVDNDSIVANRIATWDLTNSIWEQLDTASFNNTVNAMAFDSSNNLFAGGLLTTAGGNIAKRIAQWNGSAWSAISGGVSTGSAVNAIVTSGTDVFIGGVFTKLNTTVSANRVAKWNGSAWSALTDSGNNGVNGDVSIMAMDSTNNKLYVGGAFTKIGTTVSANGTARWNTSTSKWSRLGGDGTDAPKPITALAIDADGNVYAGGAFSTAGKTANNSSVSANNIAVYTHTDLTANQWKLVSLPHYDPNVTVTAAFDVLPASSYNVAGASNGWVVYRYDDSTGAYSRVKGTLAQGKGYFVKSYVDGVMDMDGLETPVTSQSTNSHCTSSKGCYIIELTPPSVGQTSRYNLLGNPFINRVQWADVRFEVGGTAGTAYTPSEALTADIADKQFAVYNGSAYQTCDDITVGCTAYIKPMQGFWIKLLSSSMGQTVKLLIPKP